jgi:hypothetical protein
MLAGNGLSNFGVGHLNRDDAVVDLYGLRAFYLQGCIDVESTVHINHRADFLIWLEARRVDLQFVTPDRNNQERILSLVIGGCCFFSPVAHVGESNCRPGDEGATGITHHPRDPSCHISPSAAEQKAKHSQSEEEHAKRAAGLNLRFLPLKSRGDCRFEDTTLLLKAG